MQTIHELLSGCVDSLRGYSATKAVSYRPRYPQLTFFLGEKSTEYIDTVRDTLRRMWLSRVDSIKFLSVMPTADGDVTYTDCTKDRGQSIDIYAYLDEVLTVSSDVFVNNNKLKMYFVLDARGIRELDAFERLYCAIDKFSDLGLNMQTMIVVLQDSSLTARAFNKEMARYIAEHPLYESIVLIGYKMKVGRNLTLDEYSTNYRLIADLMLLTNNSDLPNEQRSSAFYNRSDEAFAITASYALVDKPVYEIVVATVASIFRNLQSRCEANTVISRDDVERQLGVSPIGMSGMETFFNNYIARALPADRLLLMLPCVRTAQIGAPFRSVDEFNHRTLGAWEAFYYENYVNRMRDIIVNNDLKKRIAGEMGKVLSDSFSYAQLSLLEEAGTLDIIKKCIPAYPFGGINNIHSLNEYAKARLKHDFYEEIIDSCKEMISDIDHKAEAYKNHTIAEIGYALEQLAIDKTAVLKMHIEEYYDRIVSDYFSGHDMSEYLERFGNYNNTPVEVFDVIYRIFQDIQNSEPIFRLGFEEELDTRLRRYADEGKKNAVIDAVIETGEENVRLNTSHSLSECLKTFCFINAETDYGRQLDSRGNITVVDAKNTDSFETVKLYYLGVEALMYY